VIIIICNTKTVTPVNVLINSIKWLYLSNFLSILYLIFFIPRKAHTDQVWAIYSCRARRVSSYPSLVHNAAISYHEKPILSLEWLVVEFCVWATELRWAAFGCRSCK